MATTVEAAGRMGVLRTLLGAAVVGAAVAGLALVLTPRASADGRLLVAGPQTIEAPAGAWPSIAAIVRAGTADARAGQVCGGTVVGAYAVLTAAACVSASGIPVDAASLHIVTGRQLLTGGDGQRLAVTRIYLAPSGDVAILQLARGTTAPAMRLATGGEDALLNQPGLPAELAGWGGDVGAAVDALQQTPLQAGVDDPSITTCPGDRGGPIVAADVAGTRIQLRVLQSSADACAPITQLASTRVSDIAAWAAQIVALTVPVIPPPVQQAGTPTPLPPNARPSVRRTFGGAVVRRGKTVRLRYQVDDDSLATREVISIINPRGRLVKRVAKPMQTLSPEAIYGISWKVPKKARLGRWRFCVEAFDSEGLKDRECAFFRVRR